MKKLIAIALALMAFTSFGSQQTQAAKARERHIVEVQRARAERIKREIKREIERAGRANIYNQVSAEDSKRNIKIFEERFKRSFFEKIDICQQAPTEVKQKKPRNSLRSYDTRRENNRFERSAPARRRK